MSSPQRRPPRRPMLNLFLSVSNARLSIDSVYYKQYIRHTRIRLDKTERGVSVVSERVCAGTTNIRGVDQFLWRWLKAQAALEGKTIGQKLNEILDNYKFQVESS